jgi:transcriptional regulator
MFLPTPFKPPDEHTLLQFMRTHPFGVLVTMTGSGLDGNHLPFVLDAEPEPYGTLRGHVARANPIWREIGEGADALVIFQGPDAFISPSWYPTVVHAHGKVTVVEEAGWLRAHVEALTSRHEGGRDVPWAVGDAPEDYIRKMIGAIVGIEMPITRLAGKWKLSQNRSDRDREGVIDGLLGEGTAAATTMGALVRGTMKPR